MEEKRSDKLNTKKLTNQQQADINDAVFSDLQNRFDIKDLPAVILMLATEATPIIIEGKSKLFLGRSDPGRQIVPDVDFEPMGGHDAGISRLHAQVNYREGKWYLKDLDSTNGTWVGDDKLIPYLPRQIETEDLIHLGGLTMRIFLIN
jgi:hypothetical protein